MLVDEERLENNLIEPPIGRETPQTTQHTIGAIMGKPTDGETHITREKIRDWQLNDKQIQRIIVGLQKQKLNATTGGKTQTSRASAPSQPSARYSPSPPKRPRCRSRKTFASC